MTKPKSTVPMQKKVLSAEDLEIPASIRASLRGTRGPAEGMSYALTHPVTVVGRGDAAEVPVDDPAMSRLVSSLRCELPQNGFPPTISRVTSTGPKGTVGKVAVVGSGVALALPLS